MAVISTETISLFLDDFSRQLAYNQQAVMVLN